MGRQCYRLDFQSIAAQRGRRARCDGRSARYAIAFIAAAVEEGLGIEFLIEDANAATGDWAVGDSRDLLLEWPRIWLAGNAVVS